MQESINKLLTYLIMIYSEKKKKWDFPGSSAGKEYSAMQETLVQFLGREGPLEKG